MFKSEPTLIFIAVLLMMVLAAAMLAGGLAPLLHDIATLFVTT
jgi:hypothetical protein